MGPPDPDDIVQQAFANFAALDNRKAIERPIAFLMSTTRNLITDHFRRSARRNTETVDASRFDDILDTYDELSPEIVILDRERFHCVMDALRSLPTRQRQFLLLNRIEGLSYTAIAKANGVSISTARREVEAGVAACHAVVEAMTDGTDD